MGACVRKGPPSGRLAAVPCPLCRRRTANENTSTACLLSRAAMSELVRGYTAWPPLLLVLDCRGGACRAGGMCSSPQAGRHRPSRSTNRPRLPGLRCAHCRFRGAARIMSSTLHAQRAQHGSRLVMHSMAAPSTLNPLTLTAPLNPHAECTQVWGLQQVGTPPLPAPHCRIIFAASVALQKTPSDSTATLILGDPPQDHFRRFGCAHQGAGLHFECLVDPQLQRRARGAYSISKLIATIWQ